MSGSGVEDLEYPGRYIFDQRFPKSSLDSLRHLHRLRADLFEKMVFLEKEEVVGDDAPAVSDSGDFSSREGLHRRQSDPRERLIFHDFPLIFDWRKANGDPVGWDEVSYEPV